MTSDLKFVRRSNSAKKTTNDSSALLLCLRMMKK